MRGGNTRAMTGYVSELRRLVGKRPLILCGANGLLLDSETRLLLIHRTDNGMWSLPGGAVELGESAEETARREVREEAGLTCGALELLGVYSGPELYYRYPHGDEVHIVAVSYLCRDFSGTIEADGEEAADAGWFAPQELPSDISPPDRVIIEDLRSRFDEITAGE
jgi:8-oxo-dGTP pyrophosphatase MutT (NUDIX family)